MGTYPRLMFSFFRKFDLNGKTLIPFTTNEGSGPGNTQTDLQKAYPEANILDGFAITGHEAREPQAYEQVKSWLENLDLSPENHLSQTGTADGTTGASIVHKGYTALGKQMGKNEVATVSVRHADGKTAQIAMVIRGCVDMGDGLLWSAVNLGASKAWGETSVKEHYTEDNYVYLNQQIGSDISGTWYDAATITLGGDWRMPTYEEWHRLLHNTTHEFVKLNGRKGHLFLAKNGNYLFLPGNGYVYDTATGTPDEGFYWSSTNSNPGNSYVTYLPENSWGQSNYGRHIGIGIRAVRQTEN